MRRLVCFCPVLQDRGDEKESRRCTVGVAVSDPYLARATPIAPSTPLEVLLKRRSTVDASSIAESDSIWSDFAVQSDNFPSTWEEFCERIGHRDVEAITMTSPIGASQQEDAEAIDTANDHIKYILLKEYAHQNKVFGGSNGDLIVPIENFETSHEASTMLRLDVDLQDELFEFFDYHLAEESSSVLEGGGLDLGEVHPSVHAAFALHRFLFQHTGGWQNTFG